MQRCPDHEPSHPSLALQIFPGKSALAGLCQDKDWSKTALGPIESWPISLRTVAALVVASPLPMIVLWGPELVQIYNDGYRDVMGHKHPSGLGQPTRQCWPEVWDFNAPLYGAVIDRSETFSFNDQCLVIERNGHPEDVFFTLSFSPAFNDQGAVGGVLLTVSEKTSEVEWKKAMATATESEERLRIALEAADLGTWDLDLTTDTSAVRSLRHDQIFGYEKQQVEWGLEIATRHVLPEDRLVFQEAFARAMRTGVLSCEVRVRRPDDSIRWVAPLGRTYYDSEGRPVRMAGVVADVTERNQAQSLRQSEERFRLMANTVPQIIWVTDAEGRTEFFNQPWSNYTGLTYTPETTAEAAAAAVHPDDVAFTMAQFEQARCSGTTFLVEHRIRSAAGNYRWFLVRAEPYRDANSGQITRWFGTSVDIDDRKLAEKARQVLTERQTLQLALADRIRPLSDPEDVVAAACEMLGERLGVSRVMYAEADDTGETVRVQPGWIEGGLPSIAGAVLRIDDFGPLNGQTVRRGDNLEIADVIGDPRTASHAAAYTDIGVYAVLVIPLMKEGRLRALLNVQDSKAHDWSADEIALAQDMVDRTWSAAESARAQTDLRYERDRSKYIFDSMNEGFALIAPDWTILQMNAAALHIVQRSESEVVGHQHWEVWSHLKDTGLGAMYDRVKETGEADMAEIPFTFPDRSSGWIEIRIYRSLDGGLALFFRDITERKAAQEELQDANRRKDEFLAMLAHELRNPLAPIGAAAQVLQMGRPNEARVHQTSQIIGRQVKHMTSLIDDLLDVSRVTRGLVELDSARIDIGHVVVDALEQVTPLIRARQHHLGLHLTPEAPLVMGDKKRLVQVIVNLIQNAAKYTPEGGQLLLKTEVSNAHVLIQITDNGIGMAPELVSRAFDLFAQAERSSDRSSGGLGLGLALVKSLVTLHHGTVSCESAGLGKGSTFTVCLPRLLAAEKNENSHAPDPSSHNSGDPLRILVVDDNIDAAAMLSMLLEADGHEVMTEHGSHAALERARAEAPQVCILDIGLPEMDGNELAQRLRALPQTAESMLIAVTGYGQDSDRGRSLAAGFDHHLVKPVDTKKLSALLSESGIA